MELYCDVSKLSLVSSTQRYSIYALISMLEKGAAGLIR